MVLTAPQYTLRTWFMQGHADCKITIGNLMYDSDDNGTDDATPTYTAEYEMTQDKLTNIFLAHGYDIAFIIGNPKTKVIQPGPVAYEYTISIQPVVIEKYSGNRDIPIQLLWKAHNEIRRIIRENAVGSLKLVESESPHIERLGSTLLYMDAVEVLVSSAVSSYSPATDLVTTRRFYMRIKAVYVGFHSTPGGDYKYIGPESGLGPIEFDLFPQIIVSIPIPGGIPVRQVIGMAQGRGRIRIRDLDFITSTLTSIDVDVDTGGVQSAIPSATSRNIIDYFNVLVDEIKVTNATDVRTVAQTNYTFVNMIVNSIHIAFDDPFSGFDMDFTYDAVTQVDIG